jgi:opacity protein-like surface antigen
VKENVMRKYLLAAAAIGLTVSVASAADLPRKAPAYAPPPPPPPFSWTGFYIGVHGGAGWGTSETTLNSLMCFAALYFVSSMGSKPAEWLALRRHGRLQLAS